MIIIPAIDIIEGKCVRLVEGDYKKMTVYSKNPLDIARKFEDAGLKRLHLVDLDGAKAGAVKNWKVLETLAGKTNLVIDFGGGIKSDKDVQIVFNSGGAMATVGSIAVESEEEFTNWLDKFGGEKFFLGADVINDWIAIHGWQKTTELGVLDFIKKYKEKKVQQIFCTDVSKDGKLQGPSLDLYKKILERFPDLYFVASGGISSIKDLEDLKNIGCSAAIVGKAIYEDKIHLNDLILFSDQ